MPPFRIKHSDSSCSLLALRRFRQSDQAKDVNFTIKYYPYQLYPEATKEGEDKYQWYKKSKYGDSEDKMKMYITLMTAYGVSAGIDFKFGGTVGNTMDAHRVIQHFQEEKGPEVADKIVLCKTLHCFQVRPGVAGLYSSSHA